VEGLKYRFCKIWVIHWILVAEVVVVAMVVLDCLGKVSERIAKQNQTKTKPTRFLEVHKDAMVALIVLPPELRIQ
jgi:hypothetical protein